jgi:hypothetical protein
MNTPNTPATARPFFAAMVEAPLEFSVPLFMLPFSISMPLVPAVLFGETLRVAFPELALNFSSVLPVDLCVCQTEMIIRGKDSAYGPLITPTIPPWQCMP